MFGLEKSQRQGDRKLEMVADNGPNGDKDGTHD